jgi:hypothetical protein
VRPRLVRLRARPPSSLPPPLPPLRPPPSPVVASKRCDRKPPTGRSTAAAVSGAFFGETGAGDWIFARIPEFRLEIPTWA